MSLGALRDGRFAFEEGAAFPVEAIESSADLADQTASRRATKPAQDAEEPRSKDSGRAQKQESRRQDQVWIFFT